MVSYPKSPFPLRIRKSVKQFVGEIPNNYKNSLLSVGCGDGTELLDCVDEFERIKGIDFSTKAIELAKRNTQVYSNITIEKKDLFEEKGKFDVCLTVAVLEHIKDDSKALLKINQLLVNGGYLLLEVPAHQRLFSLHDERAGHFRRYEKKELWYKLEKSGFLVKKFIAMGFPIGNIIYLIYNFILKISASRIVDENMSRIERSKTSAPGLEEKLPPRLSFLSGLSSLIANLMAFFDHFFLNTNLGLYYLVLAKKRR